jgi:hypothetical protein
VKVRERIKRLEMKLSRDAESQAYRQNLREELTEFLYALRAWARHNQQPQTLIDTEASKSAGR